MTREEAINIVQEARHYLTEGNPIWDVKKIDEAMSMAIQALSAEAEPTVIRSRTLMPTKDFKEWAKRVRETNPNAIVIPCDAEVVSAEPTAEKIPIKLEKRYPESKDEDIVDAFMRGYQAHGEAIDKAIEALSERPHGKWIFSTSIPIGAGRESAGYKCSVCGGNFFRVDGMDFCPTCGARMTPCKGGDD